ncbi:MAG: hypothetical protein RLO21_07375 [Nitratireductor sp.]
MAKTNKLIDEKTLTKGELRKLRALQKSIGEKLGSEAFAKWYAKEDKGEGDNDPNIEAIERALDPLAEKLRIPRGTAYAIRRGRGRFIVEPVELKS